MDQPATPKVPAEAQAAYDRFVEENLARNYAGHFMHGMLGQTGMRLMNAPTFTPAYLHLISGSDAIVGLGLALQQLGAVISPVFGAAHLEHRTRIMPVANVLGGLMRIQILFLALAAWFLPGPFKVGGAILFLFLFGLFMGPQAVALQVLLAKLIPVNKRGRLQAWRQLFGGIIAATLSWVAGEWFIGRNWLGNGYATTFLAAFLLTTGGLVMLNLIVKEPVPVSVRPQARLRDRMRDFPALLTSDRGFLAFIIAQTAAAAGRVAAPFFILYAGKGMHLTGPTLGLLSLCFLGSDTASNLLWGRLGDRQGFRLVMRIGVALCVAATVLLLISRSLPMLLVGFCGLGAGLCAQQMASQTMVLEFGHREDMPMRLALANSVLGLMTAGGPLLAGALAALAGYHALFLVALAFQAAALAMFVLRVPEPRTRIA